MQVNVGKILTGLLTFFVAVIEILLGMRFILKLLAASSNAEFTLMIYDTTESLVAPFDGVFPSFDAANFTLEISTFLAMVVYGIGGFIFVYLARNFEGLTVNPGSRPSGPPAITHNPQQPVQTQPIQQVSQPMPVQPVMQQPMQPVQPIQQAPYQPMQPTETVPMQSAPQTQTMMAANPVQQPVAPTETNSLSMESPTIANEHQSSQPTPVASTIPPENSSSTSN